MRLGVAQLEGNQSEQPPEGPSDCPTPGGAPPHAPPGLEESMTGVQQDR